MTQGPASLQGLRSTGCFTFRKSRSVTCSKVATRRRIDTVDKFWCVRAAITCTSTANQLRPLQCLVERCPRTTDPSTWKLSRSLTSCSSDHDPEKSSTATEKRAPKSSNSITESSAGPSYLHTIQRLARILNQPYSACMHSAKS